MRRCLPILLCLSGLSIASAVQAEGFAAIVSPPRFELSAPPGKTLRGVIEIGNRSADSARYTIHTADWTLGKDLGVTFHDDLQPDSCRPWVSIERPEVEIPGGGAMRYRFEVAVPADAPAGECHFAVMIEGAKPSVAVNKDLNLPITGRIGVMVYVAVGAGAPQLELLGGGIAIANGAQVPAIRVRNSGSAHGRLGGYLTGTDAKGNTYDFTPADFPIMPQEEREVVLTPSTVPKDHPTLIFPVTVKGTLEWGKHRTELNERFE